MVRCVAFSLGTDARRHGYFADIDNVSEEQVLELKRANSSALIYMTMKGIHIISDQPVDTRGYGDEKCPNVAVRIYPHTDYVLIQRGVGLCHHLYHLYAAILGVRVAYMLRDCHYPIRLGVYTRRELLK